MWGRFRGAHVSRYGNREQGSRGAGEPIVRAGATAGLPSSASRSLEQHCWTSQQCHPPAPEAAWSRSVLGRHVLRRGAVSARGRRGTRRDCVDSHSRTPRSGGPRGPKRAKPRHPGRSASRRSARPRPVGLRQRARVGTPKKRQRPARRAKHPAPGPCGYLAPQGGAKLLLVPLHIDTSIHISTGLSRDFCATLGIFREVFPYRGVGGRGLGGRGACSEKPNEPAGEPAGLWGVAAVAGTRYWVLSTEQSVGARPVQGRMEDGSAHLTWLV